MHPSPVHRALSGRSLWGEGPALGGSPQSVSVASWGLLTVLGSPVARYSAPGGVQSCPVTLMFSQPPPQGTGRDQVWRTVKNTLPRGSLEVESTGRGGEACTDLLSHLGLVTDDLGVGYSWAGTTILCVPFSGSHRKPMS